MRYDAALEAHIEEQYAKFLAYPVEWNEDRSREYFLSEGYLGEGLGQIGVAQGVIPLVAKEMGELVSYGTFDNCREHGVTVTSAGGWTFCVYQHRNFDGICIEGCPTDEIKEYGPYGGEDKYDTLYGTRWQDFEGAAKAMVAMLHATVAGPVTRQELRSLRRKQSDVEYHVTTEIVRPPTQ